LNSFLGDNSFNINNNINNGNNESTEMTTNSNTNTIFSDEDFKIPSNKFVEELEVLEKKTIVMSSEEPSLARMSLFRQFDPLVQMNNDLINKTKNISFNEFNDNLMTETNDINDINGINTSSNESTTLMNFNSPLIVPNISANNHSIQINVNKNDPLFQTIDNKNSDQLSNALQTKELLFQEKLIEKERQIFQLEEKLNVVNSKSEKYEFLLNLLHNLNQEMAEIASQLIESIIAEKNELIDRCNQMTAERTQALEDVNSVEKSFYEVHNRYDKVRTALEESKQREMQLNQQCIELLDQLNEKEQMYELLKAKAEEKIEK
jgi:hypothetical protein